MTNPAEERGVMAETEFPVPEFTDVECAFGAKGSAYLTREQMGDDFYGDRNHFTRTAQTLFFKGGSLADHGLSMRPEIDRTKAFRALKAWMCSFEPKHEIKIGTVGYALSKWCAHSEVKS